MSNARLSILTGRALHAVDETILFERSVESVSRISNEIRMVGLDDIAVTSRFEFNDTFKTATAEWLSDCRLTANEVLFGITVLGIRNVDVTLRRTFFGNVKLKPFAASYLNTASANEVVRLTSDDDVLRVLVENQLVELAKKTSHSSSKKDTRAFYKFVAQLASVCVGSGWVARVTSECIDLSPANCRSLVMIGIQAREQAHASREALHRLAGQDSDTCDWADVVEKLEASLVTDLANLDFTSSNLPTRDLEAIARSPFVNPFWLLEQQVLHALSQGSLTRSAIELWSKLIDESITNYTRTLFSAWQSGSKEARELLRQTSITAYFAEKKRQDELRRIRDYGGSGETKDFGTDWTEGDIEVNPYSGAIVDQSGMRIEDYFNALLRQLERAEKDASSGTTPR